MHIHNKMCVCEREREIYVYQEGQMQEQDEKGFLESSSLAIKFSHTLNKDKEI